MDTENLNIDNQPGGVSSVDKIQNHKETAAHLELAAKHHLNAARHYEEGHPEKAAECSSKAQECIDKATHGAD